MNWGKDKRLIQIYFFGNSVDIHNCISLPSFVLPPITFYFSLSLRSSKLQRNFKSVKNSYNAVVFGRYPSPLQNWRQTPLKKDSLQYQYFFWMFQTNSSIAQMLMGTTYFTSPHAASLANLNL